MTWQSGWTDLICFRTERPSAPGIMMSNKTTSGLSSLTFGMASSADAASITRKVLLKTSWRDCLTPVSSSTTTSKGWFSSFFFSVLCNRELHSHCFVIAIGLVDDELPAVSLQEVFRQQDAQRQNTVVGTRCCPVQVMSDRRHPRPLPQIGDR